MPLEIQVGRNEEQAKVLIRFGNEVVGVSTADAFQLAAELFATAREVEQKKAAKN